MTTDFGSADSLRSEGDLNVSVRRASWIETHHDPRTKKLLDEDAKYFLRQALSTPCLNGLARCDGIYIEDLQGRRLMDFHGNNVHQVGYSHPRVIEAITEQMKALSFCPRRYTNEPAVKLAARLTSLAPGRLNKALFAPGGTSAIGMALKLARAATGRFKTVSMWDSFHGASLDAISVGGEAIFRKNAGPLLPGTEHVPPPDALHCVWDCGGRCTLKCAEYVEYVLAKEGDVAAVVAETVRSTPIIPPPEYWQIIRAACDRHGALLILDEIPIGLGRTGRMFACQHYGIEPDMLVLGKGLGGGVFPLAALLARDDLDVMPDGALGHYTHEKNPVACAAGLAMLECLDEEQLVENARIVGEHAMRRLRKLQADHELIGDVRGLGLLLGIELVKDCRTHERHADAAEFVLYRALEKGLSFKVAMGNILTLTPPLIITRAQMDEAIDILDACIGEAARTLQ